MLDKNAVKKWIDDAIKKDKDKDEYEYIAFSYNRLTQDADINLVKKWIINTNGKPKEYSTSLYKREIKKILYTDNKCEVYKMYSYKNFIKNKTVDQVTNNIMINVKKLLIKHKKDKIKEDFKK